MTVSELLTQSMALHQRARPNGKSMTRPGNWKELLSEAYYLRKQALELDPERVDPAWEAESVSHVAMMGFYSMLNLPEYVPPVIVAPMEAGSGQSQTCSAEVK